MFFEVFATGRAERDAAFDYAVAKAVLAEIVSAKSEGRFLGVFDAKSEETLQFAHERDSVFAVDVPRVAQHGSLQGVTELSIIKEVLRDPSDAIRRSTDIFEMRFGSYDSDGPSLWTRLRSALGFPPPNDNPDAQTPRAVPNTWND